MLRIWRPENLQTDHNTQSLEIHSRHTREEQFSDVEGTRDNAFNRVKIL